MTQSWTQRWIAATIVVSVAMTAAKASAGDRPAATVTPSASSTQPEEKPTEQESDPDVAEELELSKLPERERKIVEIERSLQWLSGPRKVALPCGATIELPSGYRYLDIPQSKKILSAHGHVHTDSEQGILGSEDPTAEWRAYIDYEASGYIKDDEKVDAAELLKALREGQDEINVERVKQGHPALHVGDWSESPHYDRSKHHLVWGVRVRAGDEASGSVNYNTRILGRRGYISLNLVTDESSIELYKPEAQTLLGVTTFDPGSRYADFSEKTDKVAEFGLAGLILGGAGIGAAKIAGKVGLLALIAKGGKGLVVLLLAPIAALKRWLNRSKSPTA